MRGLKYMLCLIVLILQSRIPRGMRGLKFKKAQFKTLDELRRIPRGMRGLKLKLQVTTILTFYRRIPRGMRGLKCTRGLVIKNIDCRIPRGMRGLKWIFRVLKVIQNLRRIPRGMRGLKFHLLVLQMQQILSHPARDAWIEIMVAIYCP